jgi:hypothetical protein
LHLHPDWLGIVLLGELSPKFLVLLEHASRVGRYHNGEAIGIKRRVEREFRWFHDVPGSFNPLRGIAGGFEIFNR